METYFLILWFVICPIGNHPVEIERISYSKIKCKSNTKNLEECPKHHIALFTTPKKITKVEKTIDKEKSTKDYIVFKEIKTEISCFR